MTSHDLAAILANARAALRLSRRCQLHLALIRYDTASRENARLLEAAIHSDPVALRRGLRIHLLLIRVRDSIADDAEERARAAERRPRGRRAGLYGNA
jgi:hypothetical protein